MYKKIIPILTAIAVIPSAVCPFPLMLTAVIMGAAVSPVSFLTPLPSTIFSIISIKNIPFRTSGTALRFLILPLPDAIADNTTEVLQTWDKFKSIASHMYSNVAGQRVKDLVDYANQSTDGLTTGQAVTSFIAKRSHYFVLRCK